MLIQTWLWNSEAAEPSSSIFGPGAFPPFFSLFMLHFEFTKLMQMVLVLERILEVAIPQKRIKGANLLIIHCLWFRLLLGLQRKAGDHKQFQTKS